MAARNSRHRLVAAVAGALALLASAGAARQDNSDLPKLFDELRGSTSPELAFMVERRIWDIWNAADRRDVDRLMALGRAAMSMGDYETALRRFDEVVELDPQFSEGLNKRATVRFLRREWEESLADIDRVLALEARHFGAIEGSALIFEERGELEKALEAYERVLAIHPYARGVRDRIEALRERLGQRPL